MFGGRRNRTETRGSAFAAAALVAATLGLTAPAALAAKPVASLKTGQSAFWKGAYVTSARVQDPSLCGVAGPCFEYPIRVRSAGAKVLRVAIETSDDSNGWEVRLLDPSGHEVTSGTTYTLDGIAENYDVEVFAHDPAPGLWTAQVIPLNVKNGDFRARAALQATTPPSTTEQEAKSAHVSCAKEKRRRDAGQRKRCVGPVPPDLAPDPPWHITFDQPPPMVVVEGGNYTALLGIHDPTMEFAGQSAYDCLPEETIEQHAQHCLRFTSGFASLGPGPFEVYGSSSSPVAPGGGPLHQVVYRSDGSSYSRRAGRFEFHQVHLHYHVLGIARFQFFHVGAHHHLTPAGQVLKEGFCLGNIKLYDWEAFTQSEIDPRSADNCEPAPQPDGSWRFYE
jgi:invasion protein IalB